jgi:phosphatidylglycerophosphatase A
MLFLLFFMPVTLTLFLMAFLPFQCLDSLKRRPIGYYWDQGLEKWIG